MRRSIPSQGGLAQRSVASPTGDLGKTRIRYLRRSRAGAGTSTMALWPSLPAASREASLACHGREVPQRASSPPITLFPRHRSEPRWCPCPLLLTVSGASSAVGSVRGPTSHKTPILASHLPTSVKALATLHIHNYAASVYCGRLTESRSRWSKNFTSISTPSPAQRQPDSFAQDTRMLVFTSRPSTAPPC